MNRYDYKVINTDGSFAALRRSILYVAILLSVIATALVVLFILFELYLNLIICAVIYLICFTVAFLMGKRTLEFAYSFTDSSLTIRSKNGKSDVFLLNNLTLIKNAENSDFLSKSIIKKSFIKNRIIVKNALNKDSLDVKSFVVGYENESYIMTFDDYSLTFFKGEKSEDSVF